MVPLFKVFTAPSAAAQIAEVLASGTLTQGPRVDEFEERLRRHFDHPYAVTVNSCTSALHLALHLVKREHGLPDDTEVLCTPLTCAATNFPVLANRLRIRWVDIEPTTLNINLDEVERACTPNTRILLFVHWGGQPIDYERLAQVRSAYRARFGNDLIVIEDCAHAWEARWRDRLAGAVADHFACFSFQAIKALTTGDGGLLLAPDEHFYRQARLARWFGLDRDNQQDFRGCQDIAHWGFKFHMNDLAAALGLANYPHVASLVARHRENAAFYDQSLRNVSGVTLLDRRPESCPSFWLYTLRVAHRDRFCAHMQRRGIQVNRVHGRNDTLSTLRSYQRPLPVMDAVAQDMICIPVGWWVSDEDREHIVRAIREGW
jgi:dTDP-4-amino-4,6-dideoxygalactose transaminase